MNPALSPESIEGIDKADLRQIKDTATALHQATPALLDTPLSAADVEREVRLRTAIKLKLDESMGWIAGQMADLEGYKRDLRTIKGYATSDEKRLESYMFNLLRSEKRV